MREQMTRVVAEPNGSFRNFHLHADCEQAFLAKLPAGPRIRNVQLCAHCGQAGGFMERATYVGAADGGAPMHRECLVAWFAKMDAGGWEGR